MFRNKQIDKYIIITIPRSIKRQWSCLGGNVRAGVPEERIHFFFGQDAKDYDNDMARVAEAAADDGYPFLRQFALGLESTYVNQTAGNVALFWNWARLLTEISQAGHTCVILWDDRILNIEHNTLERMVAELRMRYEDFYILQLRLRAGAEHLKAVNHPNYVDIEQNKETESDRCMFSSAIKSPILSYYGAFMTMGLWGFDESMVLSPAGANWLLKMMMETEDLTDYLNKFDASQLEVEIEHIKPEDVSGEYRSRLNNDNWLYCAPHLRQGIKAALADRRGLYSPRKIGYEFVNEPFNMGTDVHWHPKHADENIAKIRSLWLDE